MVGSKIRVYVTYEQQLLLIEHLQVKPYSLYFIGIILFNHHKKSCIQQPHCTDGKLIVQRCKMALPLSHTQKRPSLNSAEEVLLQMPRASSLYHFHELLVLLVIFDPSGVAFWISINAQFNFPNCLSIVFSLCTCFSNYSQQMAEEWQHNITIHFFFKFKKIKSNFEKFGALYKATQTLILCWIFTQKLSCCV